MPHVRLPSRFHRLLIARSTTRILVGLLGLIGLLAAGLVNQTTHSASLSSVSATLSNSRPSFRGALSAGNTEGTSQVLINTAAGAYPSTSAAQLVEGDFVSIGTGGGMGHYTVTDVLGDGSFTIDGSLGTGMAAAGADVISTQSADLTVRFTTTNAVQDGSFRVLVPAHTDQSTASDLIPDGGTFDGLALFEENTLAGEIERYRGPSTLSEDTFNIQGNSLPVEIYHYSGDLILSSNTDFGSATPDERMVVVKVDGNFTVNSGVTVTTASRKLGLVFYVGGDTQVDGTISMTARGANHSPSGSNIQPFDLLVIPNIDIDGIIPALGGSGGPGSISAGGLGQDGVNGSSGGGGGGGFSPGSGASGAGSSGTLWSGGTGGGAFVGGILVAQSGAIFGGKGGNGRVSGGASRAAGGGAGNPGGTGAGTSGGVGQPGNNGTGGLIVLTGLGNITIDNNGQMVSDGSNGGSAAASTHRGGGGSGGGGINIYHRDGYTSSGVIQANGGIGGDGISQGGNGGNGSIRIVELIDSTVCPNTTTNYTFSPGEFDPASVVIDGQTYHSFLCPYTGTGAVGTAFDGTSNDPIVIQGIINPAPDENHTQGTADTFPVIVQHLDSGNNVVDQTTTQIGIIEAVKVTASVEPLISFRIMGVNSGESRCGQITSVATSAVDVAFGSLLIDQFRYAAQSLAVSTNAAGGYAVTALANDQMGRNGQSCTGDPGNTDPTNTNCIPDSTAPNISHTSPATWNSAADKGLGYSLHDLNTTGATPAFQYNTNTGNCAGSECYKQFADREDSELPQTIFSSNAPADNHNLDVCYKAIIAPTQAAGSYENYVTYTATATF